MFAIICTCLLLFLPPTITVKGDPILHLTVNDKEWRIDLREVGFDGIDPTTMDRRKLHFKFVKIANEINQRPRSAHYEDRKIVPHQYGKQVKIAEMDTWMDLIHVYIGRRISIPISSLKPRLTTDQLKILKHHLLGVYTTSYNPYNFNRSHNLRLASKAIDHIVVMPGETFSFNQTVGQRSTTRGYKEAKVIVKGEYSEGIGGGICQTSSTLFNSVDLAGLTIVERISHSRSVPYVPKNRDATVSWGGPDFKFLNQRKLPILIVSEARNGKISVLIYSS